MFGANSWRYRPVVSTLASCCRGLVHVGSVGLGVWDVWDVWEMRRGAAAPDTCGAVLACGALPIEECPKRKSTINPSPSSKPRHQPIFTTCFTKLALDSGLSTRCREALHQSQWDDSHWYFGSSRPHLADHTNQPHQQRSPARPVHTHQASKL